MKKQQWVHIGLALIVILAIGLRVYQYVSYRSLWGDEASLARNIVNQTLLDLLTKPLDYDQGAPLLFLLIEKTLISVLGPTDFVLRLFPFLCGIGLLIFITIFSTKHFGNTVGFVTAFLVGINIQLIYYSSELKQYSTDALICFLIFALFYEIFQQGLKKQHYWLLILSGIVAATLSHPAIFFLGGCGSILWFQVLFDEKKKMHYTKIYALTGIYILWGICYVLLYMVSLESLSVNNQLSSYWAFAFIPTPPWGDLQWLIGLPFDLSRAFSYVPPFHWIIFAFTIFGLTALYKHNRWSVISLGITFFGMLLASMLKLYPIKGRMITFMIPHMALLMGIAVGKLQDSIKELKLLHLVIVPLVTLLISMASLSNVKALIENPELRYREHLQPFIAILHEEKVDEPIYIFYTAKSAYLYYQEQYGYTDLDVIYGNCYGSDIDKYIAEIEPLITETEAWLLFTRDEIDGLAIKAYLLEYSGLNGTLLKEFHQQGASLYYYQFSAD